MDLMIVEAVGIGQRFSTPHRENLHLFPVFMFSPGVYMEEDQDKPQGWLSQAPE